MAQGSDTVIAQRRLLYNSDGTNIFFHDPAPMSPDRVRAHVDEVSGTSVTTFLICPNAGQNFYYPSRVGQMYGEDLSDERLAATAMVGAGEAPLHMARTLRHLVAAGHDPLGLVIDRVCANGLEAFVTFRMNELHDVDRPDSLIISDFYREHPEWRLHDEGWGWGGLAPDFAVPEVRDRRLAELTEIVERYNIDGLEFDFQRFPHFFSHEPGVAESHIPEMTDLVGRIRAVIDRASAVRGRRILLAVRVPTTLSGCRRMGLDPVDWHRRGWIDFLTTAPFLRTLFDIPVTEFKTALPGLPVYAGVEFTAQHRQGLQRVMTPELYRGAASSLFACGADGISLFNMFCSREYGDKSWEPPFAVLRDMGDPATLRDTDKLYLADQGSGFDQYVDVRPQLPTPAIPHAPAIVRLVTGGERMTGVHLTLRLETDGLPNGVRIRAQLNGYDQEPGRVATAPRLFDEPHNDSPPDPAACLDFDVRPDALRPGVNEVAVTTSAPVTIRSAELAVRVR